MRRTKIGKSYVQRRKDGTFKKWTGIGRSLAADRRTKAKKISKSGYGHTGDQAKKDFLVKKMIKSLR